MAKKPMPPEFYLEFVHPDQLAAIGLVISQWSLMESFIETAIWKASRVPVNVGRALTSQTQALGKLDMLNTVLSEDHPTLAPQFRRVADYIRDCLLGPRNMVAHGFWITSQDTGTTFGFKYTARGKLVPQTQLVNNNELYQLARDIAQVICWLERLCAALPGLPRVRDVPNRMIPDTQIPRDCATRKSHALQPLIPAPKAPARRRLIAR